MAEAGHNWIETFHNGLIVSCQPVPGSALDTIPAIVAYARAAEAAGAVGLRIEGAANVAAVVAAVRLPVIGLIKRDLADSPVRITPHLDDVRALVSAGAAIIAVDATDRPRPATVADLIGTIKSAGRLAMADCSTLTDARAALALGADIIGTTMSGYTGGAVPEAPDLALVTACSALSAPVLAEGRYNSPELAAAAIRAGATAVVVGSAITRPEHIIGWFRAAMARARHPDRPTLAFDIGGTKTAAALVEGGSILHRVEIPTPAPIDDAGWIATIAGLADDWRGGYGSVAAAVTGRIAAGTWSALNPGTLNIPAGLALEDRLGNALGLPVLAVNDAQAAAWGEYVHGAGQGQDMVFLTVSSGIGGGIVRDGRLVTGSRGLAGSLGQVPRDGVRLETRASGFGIAAAARAAGHSGDVPGVFAAAAAGEVWAERVLSAATADLADALAGLQAIVDPDVMVIGGGVGLAPGFLDRLSSALAGRHPSILVPNLCPAALGRDAGLIGAAALARSHMS